MSVSQMSKVNLYIAFSQKIFNAITLRSERTKRQKLDGTELN